MFKPTGSNLNSKLSCWVGGSRNNDEKIMLWRAKNKWCFSCWKVSYCRGQRKKYGRRRVLCYADNRVMKTKKSFFETTVEEGYFYFSTASEDQAGRPCHGDVSSRVQGSIPGSWGQADRTPSYTKGQELAQFFSDCFQIPNFFLKNGTQDILVKRSKSV